MNTPPLSSVSQRLILLFGFLVLLVIGVSIGALISLNNVNTALDSAHHAQQTSAAALATAGFEATVVGVQQARMLTLVPGIAALPPILMPTVETFDMLATVTQIAELNTWSPNEKIFSDDPAQVPMVEVPAGCFVMGSSTFTEAQPVHEWCFETVFWLDKYEVTNAQFDAQGGGAAAPGIFTGKNQPRDSVTWAEAKAFCETKRGAGARLPTEPEWEYAARGSDSLVYPWGNQWVADNALTDHNAKGTTADIGSFPNGVSWIGAMDMVGNVWEWTSSMFVPYPYTLQAEQPGDESTQYTIRGGSLRNNRNFVRSFIRVGALPTGFADDLGFRCARSAE